MSRRVLVTGADGFIGSHLVERLIADGDDVTALCVYNSNGSRGWLDGVSVESELGDIRDPGFVSDLIGRGFDVVYHLAALIDVPHSYVAPESYIQTNVIGTMNVLRAAAWAGDPRIVHVSTSEVYGTPDTVPIRETHPLRPQSPYAASKVGADALVMAWHCLGHDVRIVRPFNTYGPRQSTRGVLAHILTELLAGKREVLLGNTDPRRDLTFVSDTVDGIIRAAALPAGEVVHLGTGRSVSISDLFVLCVETLGVDAYFREVRDLRRPDASEVMVLQSDPSKAKALMGWEAKVTLEEGIERTWKWLRSRS